MKSILISYFNKDEQFKKIINFSGFEDEKRSEEERVRKYEKWKENYETERLHEKKANRAKTVFITVTLLILAFIFYKWISGDLIFIGQNTEITKAKIVNTNMNHLGKGFHYQTVTYEFKYLDSTYKGRFEAGKKKRDTRSWQFCKSQVLNN